MSEQTIVTVDTHDEFLVMVVHCTAMDEDSTGKVQKHVSAAAGQSRHLPVVLDLSKVELLPSLSLGALVNLMRECKENGQRFVLAGVRPLIRECLAVTRLDKLLEICDDVEDARNRLRISG
ncbi:MAG: STAS domain-containing protein [Phycisphaerae bacterium]|nr:STAS domain-containing protein [Phycisphaerae bacterium]